MKAVRQEDNLGCAVACVAFVLGIKYKDALKLFEDGESRVKEKANFYCREIVSVLDEFGLKYEYKFLKPRHKNKIYKTKTIVFIQKSKKYRYGHFICRYKNSWMDPWINLPKRSIKAGFRKRLPGKPTYAIFKGQNQIFPAKFLSL